MYLYLYIYRVNPFSRTDVNTPLVSRRRRGRRAAPYNVISSNNNDSDTTNSIDPSPLPITDVNTPLVSRRTRERCAAPSGVRGKSVHAPAKDQQRLPARDQREGRSVARVRTVT